MKKVYIVCWGSGNHDDKGNPTAYANVHGVYPFLKDAQKGLVECKDQFYDEIVNNPDFDDEAREYAETNTYVYGSVNDNYFEIDNYNTDCPCETYITIVEKEIIE